MTAEFEAFIDDYDFHIAYIRRMAADKEYGADKDFWRGMRAGMHRMLRSFKDIEFYKDTGETYANHPYTLKKLAEISKEDQDKYNNLDDSEGLDLCYTMTYRCHTIPIFDDDAGQQFVAYVGGKYYGAGSYTDIIFACDYFSDVMDDDIDYIPELDDEVEK